jgi:2-C-methyl-D-erythritol 4-phosphate cytidylyltransferase/2-C-methyl-D-erythritol 2,4-cyclodiphosphate synthase
VHDITLILLAAGQSTRFGLPTKKQWLYQGDRPLWQKVVDDFKTAFDFQKTVIVTDADTVEYLQLFTTDCVVAGGNSRQASLRNALEHVSTPYVLVNDVARCCLDVDMVMRVLQARQNAACIVPTLGVVDTLYVGDEAVDRDQARLIQTPQLSRTDVLRRAIAGTVEYTDESSAIRALGETVSFVEGSSKAHKLTRPADRHTLPCLIPPSPHFFTGYGIDIHPFEAGKEMKLCGITIDSPFGFKAHSDGDVAIHALIDALLGAAGMGDIGEWFPDTDTEYAGADSLELLEAVVRRIRGVGFAIRNVDMTILAQTPRLLPYKAAMRRQMAHTLSLPLHRVNIKATTAEKLGFVGRKEGVTVHATATLGYFDWTQERL